ncbi:MAG TPA: outer membrane beta-barrel protein [Dinghuibacter sp.]|uniref:outer membrane beta-barrel protein n=1 Tax=Dinghuibacter sp. TaxID=2024697 RepID=UPI002B50957F|nr:outer membrane beta-barrel protein [Dinghuibacter sp.]HTJ13580.1 outer membrane beta-barrel protein [Dinghuibacter sp.]
MRKTIILFSAFFVAGTAFGQDLATNNPVAGGAATPSPARPSGFFSWLHHSKDTTGIEAKPKASDPFAFGDFSWLNGTSRKTTPPAFDSKYFTGDVTFDLNYTHSYNSPIDNTVVGSTALARDNELQLSFMGFGGDIHYGNIRGRVMMQFGTRSTVVPRNDGSSYKGQYDLQTIYRYISEAYAGYHWDVWHGINLDAGIFMSYIGLFSYNNFENWGYQPSYTSDNTPWFFNGLRLQTFPTDKLKVEFWLVNGWQSYGMFNRSPGIGVSIYYRPKETVDYVFNNYYGKDDEGAPGRLRFHSDNSYQLRYVNHKQGFITKAAFSLTGDLGFESGDGVSPFGKKTNSAGVRLPSQNFISGMVYNRLWFGEKQKWAWTIGGGYMHNPGQYLVLAPTGYADTLYQQQTGPGSTFNAWDGSTSIDYMPAQNLTLKFEFVHRKVVNIGAAPGTTPLTGYFAGHGGVTGPTGYTNTGQYTYTSSGASVAPPLSAMGGWMPDLVPQENRIILALLVRF